MNRMNKYALPIANNVSKFRRQAGAKSPKAFAQIYLQGFCDLPFSRMHEEMLEIFLEMTTKRNVRVALAAPRGHSKSGMACVIYGLWCVLYGLEKFILILSDTAHQAEIQLNGIKKELLNNPLLLEDFPEICRPLRGRAKSRPNPWRTDRIRLPNDAMIATYGANQGLRGARHGKERPSLIIADDLESFEGVASEEQRNKLYDWFQGTLLHAGQPGTNFVVLGTVLHYDSLLANLIDPNKVSGWTSKKYQAIESFSDNQDLWDKWSSIFSGREEFQDRSGPDAARDFFEANQEAMLAGTKVLWPELEDYYSLMVQLISGDRRSFQAEKQNDPIDPQQCMFTEDKIVYWDKEFADERRLLESIGNSATFFGACDPSLGVHKTRGDYSAIVVVCIDEDTDIMYVLVADIARRDPNPTLERIVQYAKMYKFREFVVEGNHFQQIMVDDLERRAWDAGARMRIKSVKNTTNKIARIANLEPEVAQGRIRFCQGHHLLMDQLRQFPVGKHDDGPDALEMAVQISRNYEITLVGRIPWA